MPPIETTGVSADPEVLLTARLAVSADGHRAARP